MAWCKRMMRKRASFRKDVVSEDEVHFSIKVTTGERIVHQLRGTSCNHFKYTKKILKKPEKLLALCGITEDER